MKKFVWSIITDLEYSKNSLSTRARARNIALLKRVIPCMSSLFNISDALCHLVNCTNGTKLRKASYAVSPPP